LNPDSGDLLVDGENIHNNLRGWQSDIGYIPQQIFIFNETIRSNIALGIASEDIDDSCLQRVIKIAQLEKLIERLPTGLDTIVGENGIKLSGGERQRLGIARALYRDPDILIMDEATAALDNETEQEFINAINALSGQKTILIIAHRLTTIENCDIVFSLENGKVRIVKNKM
jgi:ATP-binding cassette subfamily C protein